jgi:glycosyltransferase involved in cell wall biosynthesis
LIKYILSKKADFIVAVSHDLKKFMEKVWKVPKWKLTTIHSPILGEEMFRNALKEPEEYKALPPKSIKIVAVARLSPKEKDFQTLLRAFSLLKEKYKNAKLFLVGGGDKKDVAQIIQWIEGLSLRDSVFYLGHRANPYPYIKYADISVLSSFSEGFPRVVAESMALGCPVVATDCPFGPRELIGENENGILVPMKDYIKMAEGMIRILEDDELRKRIIENAKRKAEEFRISTSVQKFEELLIKLLKEANGR